MFIECLDARRMMAGVDVARDPPGGLDTTFAGDGRFAFRKHFVASGPITRGDQATFVCGEIAQRRTIGVPYVVKVKDDGTVDAAFGDDGYARLPFRDAALQDDPEEPSDGLPLFEFTGVAYDAANDRVYVAAVRHDDDDGATLGLTRLTGSGAVDTAYGSHRGTFSYAPPTPPGDNSTASARVAAINPLADGAVVLAVDRQTHTIDSPDHADAAGDQSLALIKLRADGSRAPNYGTHGTRQLLGGTVGKLEDVEGTSQTTRAVHRGFFSDVRTDANGVTHVLLRYETGVSTRSNDPDGENDEAERGRFDLKARTVSATGVVDAATAYSWELLDTTGVADAESRVTVAAPDGDRVRVLVTGQPDFGGTAVLYTLRPGERARRRLAPKGVARVFAITRSPDGDWFAFNDGLIARLNGDFAQNADFGVDGVASAGDDGSIHIRVGGIDDANDTNGDVLADDQGRFVALGGNGLVRFA